MENLACETWIVYYRVKGVQTLELLHHVVTHFWVPIKNKINKPKEVRKITGGRSDQKTVRKLVKEFKNTRIEFLTVYS